MTSIKWKTTGAPVLVEPDLDPPCGERAVRVVAAFVGAVCAGFLVTVLFSGCGGAQAHAVDPSQARAALKIALDQWKKGETISAVEASATPMTIQDFDWMAGARLVDYEVLSDGLPEDANLRVQVKLTLRPKGNSSSKPIEKKVWYLVGTSPSTTVFRDALRR